MGDGMAELEKMTDVDRREHIKDLEDTIQMAEDCLAKNGDIAPELRDRSKEVLEHAVATCKRGIAKMLSEMEGP